MTVTALTSGPSIVVDTMLQQLGGARQICILTGCKIIYDNEGSSVKFIFPRQTGKDRITHLIVTYNRGSDLYDIAGHRYNRRSFQCPQIMSLSGVYGEDLKRVCEDITGLYFTLR